MASELVRPVGLRRRRWTQHIGAGLLLSITSATVATRAAGESNTARPESSNPLFFDGLRALETLQYAKAKQLFERLYRGSAAPDVLYQLGRVAQGEGKDVLAADLFRRYRELVGGQVDAASKSVIDGHLTGLKQPVTEVRIVAPQGDFLSVDGQLIGRSPLVGTVLVAPGRHRFALDSNGSRFESDVLNIPEGRPAQVNLSSGNRGAAVAVLSLPPAAMLAFTGDASLDATTTESIRRSIGSAMAKEQTILIPSDKTRTLFGSEPTACVELPDCLNRVAERAEARSVVIIRLQKAEQRVTSVQSLLGAQVVIRDVATKQVATEASFSCNGCSGAQLVERFGQTVGQMIATANNRPRTMLTVKTTPSEASVFVDGQRIGETPLERMSFAGKHSVKAVKNGYESVEQILDLQLHQANSIDLKLSKQTQPSLAIPIHETPLYRPKARIIAGSMLLGFGRSLLIAGCVSFFFNVADGYYWTRPLTKAGFGLLGSSVGIGLIGIGLMAAPGRSASR